MVYEQKKYMVRLLTNTLDPGCLMEVAIDDIMEATEIFHILAASKLVAQTMGTEFKLPEELKEITALLEKLTVEKK